MIFDTLEKTINQARKQLESDLVVILTTLKSAIQIYAKNKKTEITDKLVIDVLFKELKQRKKALDLFKTGNRHDLVIKTEKEITIINTYIPKEQRDEPLTEEAIDEIINNAIIKTGATSIQDMRNVIPVVMKKIKGRSDTKIISQLVKTKLSNK